MKKKNTNTQTNPSSKIKKNQKANLTSAVMTNIIKRTYHLIFFLLEINNKMTFLMIMKQGNQFKANNY